MFKLSNQVQDKTPKEEWNHCLSVPVLPDNSDHPHSQEGLHGA